MADPLEEINAKLAELREWMVGHDVAHKQIDRDVAEVRDDLYAERNGVKPRLRDVEGVQVNCPGRQRSGGLTKLGLGVLEKVIAGAVLALLFWLLFVYRTVAQ